MQLRSKQPHVTAGWQLQIFSVVVHINWETEKWLNLNNQGEQGASRASLDNDSLQAGAGEHLKG